MLNYLIDQVCHRLMEKLDFSHETVTYYELTQSHGEETISRIFTERFEKQFTDECQRIAVQGGAFDYSADAVQRQLRQLINELKKHLRFTRKQTEAIIREVLQMKMEFIIRPLTTAEKELFQAQTARTVEEIATFIRRFGVFRYYSDALANYASSKSITHLTQGQFRMLLTDINLSLFPIEKTENILKLCGQIMNNMNELTGQTSDSLPVDLLIEAFDDRSMTDAKEAMLIEQKLENLNITLYGLRQVLNRFQILKEKRATVPESKPQASPVGEKATPIASKDTPLQQEPSSKKTAISTVQKEDSGELIDINRVIEETTTRTRSSAITPVAEPPREEEIDREITGEFIREELVPKFNDETKTVKILNLKEAEVLVPVETLMTPKDEKIFMKKIFQQDESLFRNFIQRINTAKRWKHAMKEIDELLHHQHIDPFCREAVRLSDIVYQRYYPPEENS